MIPLGPQHWNGASEAEAIDVALALGAIAVSIREDRWVNLPPAE